MSWFRRLWNRLCAWLARHGLLPRAGIFYIGGSDSLPPPLSRDVEAQMIARLDEGDFEVRQILIEHNLRLVAYIARRFDNTGINIEDLISIGTIGLIKAINTYRSDKNIKLATYASRCIENEILMYLRKNANQKVEVSFDEPLNTDWDGNELLLSDILGTDGDTVLRPIEDDVDRQLLTTAVSRLSEREREIITLRFGLGGREEKTQKEVADYLGISQSYISRLEKRIIARLKREIRSSARFSRCLDKSVNIAYNNSRKCKEAEEYAAHEAQREGGWCKSLVSGPPKSPWSSRAERCSRPDGNSRYRVASVRPTAGIQVVTRTFWFALSRNAQGVFL